MKIALAIILVALAALASGRAQAPASPSAAVAATASGIFVVRPDPRECPSPLCGGYWVSLANHARTRCSDGLLRPRCYVAYLLDSRTDELSPVSGSLAQGVLDFQVSPDFGRLGQLAVSAVWAPVGQLPATGRFLRLRDTGIRCIRAPCFSIRTSVLNSAASPTLVSALELGPAKSGAARRRANAALSSADGLLAAGDVSAVDGGRVFRASQVYFRAPMPRA